MPQSILWVGYGYIYNQVARHGKCKSECNFSKAVRGAIDFTCFSPQRPFFSEVWDFFEILTGSMFYLQL